MRSIRSGKIWLFDKGAVRLAEDRAKVCLKEVSNVLRFCQYLTFLVDQEINQGVCLTFLFDEGIEGFWIGFEFFDCF